MKMDLGNRHLKRGIVFLKDLQLNKKPGDQGDFDDAFFDDQSWGKEWTLKSS